MDKLGEPIRERITWWIGRNRLWLVDQFVNQVTWDYRVSCFYDRLRDPLDTALFGFERVLRSPEPENFNL